MALGNFEEALTMYDEYVGPLTLKGVMLNQGKHSMISILNLKLQIGCVYCNHKRYFQRILIPELTPLLFQLEDRSLSVTPPPC